MNTPEYLTRPWNPQQLKVVDLPNGQWLLDLDGIHGFLLPHEVSFIFDLMGALPRGGRYAEIGSFMGLSSVIAATSLLSRGNTNAKIFCIDTWEGSMEHQGLDFIRGGKLFDVFQQNVSRANVGPIITPCRGKSTEVVHQFDDASFDMIFIDGDHTYDGALADMELWFPKLKPGGRFLGHDAIPVENPTCGVRRALNDFCTKHNFSYSLVEPPAAHYIWEVQYR